MYMMGKQLTLSIIIPAYNEEHYLRSCLDSIAAQTHQPDEVIVVNNNSTDTTAAVAAEYNFVTVVAESRQGRGYARTKGFNTTNCDIIGRIDADSVLAPDWCERVLEHFQDSTIGGVTGVAKVALLPRIQRPKSILWPWLYTLWSVAENGFELMWGANMAIPATVWQEVKAGVCNDDRLVHEDQDISFLVSATGRPVIRDNKLLIYTDGQTFNYFPKLLYYTWLRYRTKRRHVRSGAYRRIPKQYSRPYRTLLWVIGAWVLIPFFTVSLVLWPLDIAIRTISRTLFRAKD